ncbi:uncharacterized protein JCM6883_007398 [Sporobolomyces salmoneus]|uniref:uncharacterized protein n=1 Tax=Sporobolomyces salmoneus TaxID=183962 RepID=UPI003172F983
MNSGTDTPPLKPNATLTDPSEHSPSTRPNSLNKSFLDVASWEHVERLCEQLLTCSKISLERWKAPLIHVLEQLDSYLDEPTLTRLANANAAQARATLEVVNRPGTTGDRNKRVLEDWWHAEGSGTRDDLSEEQAREERREVWRNAAMLLSTNDDDSEEEEGQGRHLRDMSTISSLSMDEAWLEVEAMEKIPILSLQLETTETTLSLVKNGEATLGITFKAGIFEGSGLFGRESLVFDEDDLKVINRLGGTFKLTTTQKNIPRLERIVEFLAFAVISLRLESVLLEDVGCPRPEPSSPTETTCPSPELHPSSADSTMLENEEVNTSALDPKLPGSYDFEDGEADDDWGYAKRSWRSSFSNKGVLAWMRLANPRAQLPQSRSLRRSVTLPANDTSPLTLRSISTVPIHSLDSSSPSPSPDGKRQKVANKRRGIRNQLRDKIGRNKGNLLSPAGSDDEEEADEVAANLGKATRRNTSMLGLQIAGIDMKSSSWSLPWSNTSSHEDVTKSDTFKDDASIARTETTTDEGGEKPPPRRFEKVIEDLSRFLLSTSPDVLYPPPHLLFRLRQQELEASLDPTPSTPMHLSSKPPSPTPLPSRAFDDHGSQSIFLNPSSASHFKPSALQRAHALPSSHSLALNFAEGLPDDNKQVGIEERRTVNTSTATRIGLDAKASLASLSTNNSSVEGVLRHQAMQFLVQVVPKDAAVGTSPCEPFRWLTLYYFDSHLSDDRSLPDMRLETFIRNFVLRQSDRCTRCDRPHGEHILVLLHHDERIEVSLSHIEAPNEGPTGISTWNSCGMCQARSPSTPLTSIAGSFSTAKFIELLCYDPNFVPMPELCEHASTERSALVRCFAIGTSVVRFTRSSISLYELRLPTAVDPDVVPSELEDEHLEPVDSIDTLKDEIARFFRSARARVKVFREELAGSDRTSSEVPATVTSDGPSTSTRHVRSDSERTIIDTASRGEVPSISQVVEGQEAAAKKEEEHEEQGRPSELELLRRIDQFIDREEEACQILVEDLSPQELNIGRSTFQVKAEALISRLDEWQAKHLDAHLDLPPYDVPPYFSQTVLALPVHSNVLLRTNELSSILAVALSTPQFKEESRTVSAASSRRVTPSTPNFGVKSRQSSLRLPIPTFSLEEEDTPTPLDPDNLTDDFRKPPSFELVSKLKKPPRASGSVFRNLVRKKSGEISTPSTPTSDYGSFTLDSKKRTIKDSVLNDFLKTKDQPPSASRTPRAVPSIISGLSNRREGSSATTLSLADDVLAQFASSGSAAGTIRSKVAPSNASSASLTGSSIAESDSEADKESVCESREDDELTPLATDLGSNSSRLFDGLRSGLDSLRTRAGGGTSPRLGTPYEETSATTEHVKLKVTLGDKRWTTTAFYARRFKELRASCGLSESLFIESLSRCSDLNPSGGKSSAAFLITGNSRFMLKELASLTLTLSDRFTAAET